MLALPGDAEPGPCPTLLGKTRDDAAGEAFDKVAKLRDAFAVRFTFAKMKGTALDFSFSGMKTAVLRWVEVRDMQAEIDARRALLRANPDPCWHPSSAR